MNQRSNQITRPTQFPRLVTNEDELRRHGVVRVPIDCSILNCSFWASELSQLTPEILTAQGDGEYAFYRNILEEPEFPFDKLLLESSIGAAIQQYFGIASLRDELRLDDAFCIHYNTSQDDTSGGKHVDPSDITVNLCLEKTQDVEGSQVLFYGTQQLFTPQRMDVNNMDKTEDDAARTSVISPKESGDFSFLVEQEEGYATIHWGHHPHRTMPLTSGRRTNVVLTYCYSDSSRSDAALRCCYTTS